MGKGRAYNVNLGRQQQETATTTNCFAHHHEQFVILNVYEKAKIHWICWMSSCSFACFAANVDQIFFGIVFRLCYLGTLLYSKLPLSFARGTQALV